MVKAWRETVEIPTYKIGEPEGNPMFLEKRVYQGSSGLVYPYAVVEKIADEKTPEQYQAIFLENDFLKIMILPQLGGRIQRAYDKVQKRDFVYYNSVIKPALVGLAGPWISGGIEFNWPQHHRPSTFLPIDSAIEENADGSKTVWVNEIEVMFRTQGRAGFTLYPDKAYLEIKGRLFNRTPFPQTFLWWANPAVKVNKYYQSVFPPDVYAVFDHGKRDVSDFPVATGTYYKKDYSPGTDISRYSNIPVPTSYMAIQSAYNFIGCYEHDTQAGMVHVADHHISPGKKQWTWGDGDFGYAWDRNLTDNDGPYIELMTGVFTDNQPDFSWLSPNEGKSFEQYFMPYAVVGEIKNASKEAILGVTYKKNIFYIKVYTTSIYKNATVTIVSGNQIITSYSQDISPRQIFEEEFDTHTHLFDWQVTVADSKGNELIAYKPDNPADKELPAPAMAAKSPAEIEQVEDLYLNGLHLEQYRHATYNPVDYYEEGLRRSPGDFRCNNAMGLLLLKRGQFKKAEPYFRKAVEKLTERNPNPYDGEPYYNLGWCLLLQDKIDDAYDSFYKSTWNDAWQHSGFLSLARVAAKKHDWENAIYLVEKSLIRNYNNPITRHLKTCLLRKTGATAEAKIWIAESLKLDLFNFGCLFEDYLTGKQDKNKNNVELSLDKFLTLMRYNTNNYLELALDYAWGGFYAEGVELLTLCCKKKDAITPMVFYYLGWLSAKQGKPDEALGYYKKAAAHNPRLCFPNKIEEIVILQNAISHNPDDDKAPYYLGNLWYDKKQYDEAIICWERSVKLNGKFATPYRNLALANYNKLHNKDKAVKLLDKAFKLDTKDARVLMEFDQLHKINRRPFAERLKLLDQYDNLVRQRDDLYLEKVTLLNNSGDFDSAKEMLLARKFHPWEGGEGKVIGQFLITYTALAKQAILEQDFVKALELLNYTGHYPENLGEGKLYNTPENDINYLMGCAYQGLGKHDEAKLKFMQATEGQSEPTQAIYYNDPQPDKIVYQGMAWLKLGDHIKAGNIFSRFIAFGEQQKEKTVQVDYFAVSLPDMLVFDVDLDKRNQIFCKYLIGLGHMGLSNYKKGEEYLKDVITMDINHQGAAIFLKMKAFFKDATNNHF